MPQPILDPWQLERIAVIVGEVTSVASRIAAKTRPFEQAAAQAITGHHMNDLPPLLIGRPIGTDYYVLLRFQRFQGVVQSLFAVVQCQVVSRVDASLAFGKDIGPIDRLATSRLLSQLRTLPTFADCEQFVLFGSVAFVHKLKN
jgi:hypothetical protein